MCEYFENHIDPDLYEFILVDNGSDIKEPSGYTTIRTTQNFQTTGGWLLGLKYADFLEEQTGCIFDYYLFSITSTRIPVELNQGDILTPMVHVLDNDHNAVGIHASLTLESTTAWGHLKNRGQGVRRTWFIDNIFALYRANWFNNIGRFDPALTYAYGVDLETGWKARAAARGIYVDDRVLVEKITDIGYTMDRMNMSAQDRQVNAREEADRILIPRYGHNWQQKLREEFVRDEWR